MHHYLRLHPRVTVIRRFQYIGSECPIDVGLDQLNILVVTARPDMRSDIEYLLITRRIMDVVARLKDPKIPVYIEIVRPGTWSALAACLKNRSEEGLKFHMIHMDVHVLSSKRVATKGKT